MKRGVPSHWLLLRGLGREGRHWGALPQHLRDRLGAAVHCLDLPGIGTEASRRAPWSVAAMVADVRRRWRDLAPTETTWGLLTISLGGMVGLEWTARHPDDFAGHVVINSSARELGPAWWRLRVRQWPRVLRAVAMRDEERRERLVLRMTSRYRADADLARVHAFYARARPMRRRAFLAQLAAAARFALPARVEVPTLVVSSLGDELVDPRCSAALAECYGFEHRLHPSAGHDLALDAPLWLCAEIQRWLGEL